MTSAFFKMLDADAENLKVKLNLFKRCTRKYARKESNMPLQFSRNLLSCAGQLSDSLKKFVRQKMTDKNNRVLLLSNTSLSKFIKHYKFNGKLSKYRGNMCNFHPLETKSPKIVKILYGHFSGL